MVHELKSCEMCENSIECVFFGEQDKTMWDPKPDCLLFCK